MAVRTKITEKDGIYFITITCARWLNLFEVTDGYDIVYRWFDYLKSSGHFICGYVIMPNHMHLLIGFRSCGKSINTIVGNGKRFMAYELVKRLKDRTDLLEKLRGMVNEADRRRGKLHQVFEPSFDWKECLNEHFIEQKLTYIHENPCNGKWKLVQNPEDYPHSSAAFYIRNDDGNYHVTNCDDLEDVDLTRY